MKAILVDDERLARNKLKILLTDYPQVEIVGEADNGFDALGIIKRSKPDVVLMDVEMPGINGIEVAQDLRESGITVKILALSAYDDEAYIEGLLNAGASGYLTKEEANERIVEAVRGVARGEDGWLSRRISAKLMRRGLAGDRDPLTDLSAREVDVVRLLAKGLTNGQMAVDLGIAERTVRFHLHNIYDKLGLRGRGEAIVWAVNQGEKVANRN